MILNPLEIHGKILRLQLVSGIIFEKSNKKNIRNKIRDLPD
jgi:hypothetical protein